MSGTANEFARPIRIDTLGDSERTIVIRAEAAERDALARRFDLVAIERLAAEARVRRAGAVIHAEGRLEAAVTQSCVATGEPLPTVIEEPFVLRFVPPEMEAEHDEVELSDTDCDTIAYEGGAVDLGEAVAETLSLALDPFPRSPHADAVLKAAGVVDESDVGPFAALKALRDRMER